MSNVQIYGQLNTESTRRAQLQKRTSGQELGEKDVGACSALSPIPTDAAEELFLAENAFLKETNYHTSDRWEIWGIQKQAELVGKRR